MFDIVLNLAMAWIASVLFHEMSHGIAARMVGAEEVVFNLFCKPAFEKARTLWSGRALSEKNNVRIGICFLSASATISHRSDMASWRHAVYTLAGPVSNLFLALFFGLRGETLPMMINLFIVGSSFSDVTEVVALYVQDSRKKQVANVVALALFALPLVLFAPAVWYSYVLIAYVGLSIAATVILEHWPAKKVSAEVV
jgi:hypothetical protein